MENQTLKTGFNIWWGVVVLVVIALVVGGYFYWKDAAKTPEEEAAEAVEKTLQSAIGGTLPEIAPVSNPLEKLPEINPVEKANPFKGLQTNPFK